MTTLPERVVVSLLVVVVEDFAMPTVGFITVLDTFGLGVGTFGLKGTVCVSAVVRTGSCVLGTLSEREILDWGVRWNSTDVGLRST